MADKDLEVMDIEDTVDEAEAIRINRTNVVQTLLVLSQPLRA